MNSTFGARWLASPEVIIQVLFTSKQPRVTKWLPVSLRLPKRKFFQWTKKAVPKNTKMATKYLMASYLTSPASYYKAKNQNTMPDLITPYRPSRSLRSMVANLLILPKCRTKTYGERAFAVAGPTLWNSLPQFMRELTSVNQFKAHLKTYLFDK